MCCVPLDTYARSFCLARFVSKSKYSRMKKAPTSGVKRKRTTTTTTKNKKENTTDVAPKEQATVLLPVMETKGETTVWCLRDYKKVYIGCVPETCVRSPEFALHGCTWKLKLFPQGNRGNTFAIYLELCNNIPYGGMLSVEFSFSILHPSKDPLRDWTRGAPFQFFYARDIGFDCVDRFGKPETLPHEQLFKDYVWPDASLRIQVIIHKNPILPLAPPLSAPGSTKESRVDVDMTSTTKAPMIVPFAARLAMARFVSYLTVSQFYGALEWAKENPQIDCSHKNCILPLAVCPEEYCRDLFSFVKQRGGITRDFLCGPENALISSIRSESGASFELFLAEPTTSQGGVVDWSAPDCEGLTPLMVTILGDKHGRFAPTDVTWDVKSAHIVQRLDNEALECIFPNSAHSILMMACAKLRVATVRLLLERLPAISIDHPLCTKSPEEFLDANTPKYLNSGTAYREIMEMLAIGREYLGSYRTAIITILRDHLCALPLITIILSCLMKS